MTKKATGLGVPMEVQPHDLSHAGINLDLGEASAYTRAIADWIDRALR